MIRTKSGRWNGIKALLLAAPLLMALPANAPAGTAATTSESARINGVANFLVDRANDNFLYVVEKRIVENGVFREYFPATYDLIISASLMRALQVPSTVWEATINKDIDELVNRYFDQLNDGTPIFIASDDKKDGTVSGHFRRNLQAVLAGKAAFVGSGRIDALTEAQQKIAAAAGKTYQDLEKAVQELDMTVGALRSLLGGADAAGRIQRIKNAVNEWKALVEESTLLTDKEKEAVDRILGELQKKVATVELIEKHLRNVKDGSNPYVIRVSSACAIVQYLDDAAGAAAYRNRKQAERMRRQFDQFREFAMGIAQLADARTDEQVQATLKGITMPPVSFGVKRKQGEGHFLISSYLGIAGGAETTRGDAAATRRYAPSYGLFAPVGFEWSVGCGRRVPGKNRDGYSLSVFASIVDFGPAVNAQLSERNEEFTFRDIVAPGLFFVYGIKDLPLAVGVGYQHSKGMHASSAAEHHALLFLSFDMPLFTLY